MAHFEEPKKEDSSFLGRVDRTTEAEKEILRPEFVDFRSNIRPTVVEKKPDEEEKIKQVRIELKKDKTKDVPTAGSVRNAVVFSPSENKLLHKLNNSVPYEEQRQGQASRQPQESNGLFARLRKLFN